MNDNSRLLKVYTQKDLEVSEKLKMASWHHIDSFDYSFEVCLARTIANLRPVHVPIPPTEGQPNPVMRLWIDEAEAHKPFKEGVSISVKDTRMLPTECRQRALTYAGKVMLSVAIQVGNNPVEKVSLEVPGIPVMVMSKLCHLRGMNETELVKHKENSSEFGGYFIVHGLEKLMRLLIVAKRNYPIAIYRPTYTNRGRYYTGYAMQMRCVRDDQFAQTVTLHYLTNGEITLRILYHKQEFLIPVILIMKALVDCSDEEIFLRVVKSSSHGTDIGDRVELLITEGKRYHMLTRKEDYLSYLGGRFRTILEVGEDLTDQEVGTIFLRDYILVHLNDNAAKFDILCMMLEKLYALVSGAISPDNLDSAMSQEVLLPGQVYLGLLCEKLQDILIISKAKMVKDIKTNPSKIRDLSYIKKVLSSQALTVGKKMEYFLATGNLISHSNLDLQQTTGYTIVADKLNHTRYLSHFRSIHRGQYFAEMKTTTVRKLLPESWGFVCPVHTPDGAPCGLLNHIAQTCTPVTREALSAVHFNKFVQTLTNIGLVPVTASVMRHGFDSTFMHVVCDGKLVGYVPEVLAAEFVDHLRKAKIQNEGVPPNLEIAHIPRGEYAKAKQFAGIFLFTTPGRFCRPVQNLACNKVEWIGALEQVYLSIAATVDDIRPDTTHQELRPSNILSIVAATIPFLEYNQSPRNMYQCQMGKQTMATPYHNHPYRSDNKVYRLTYPQLPIVRTKAYEDYDFDLFPSGTNAVVAVISYTGYDMEDAMILNKSSYERGMAHGCIYKSYMRSPAEEGAKLSASANTAKAKSAERFKLLHKAQTGPVDMKGKLDSDGLPMVGAKISYRDPELCLIDTVKGEPHFYSYKDNETAYVEEVKLMSNESSSNASPDVMYKMRYTRNPVIGDKFSSRHGQKGVLSFLWPQIDMPFTESGITPDVIINPHAFPSRMTIGMLIESLAGKSGALHGHFQTVEAFEKFPDEGGVLKYFGDELTKAGFNHYGTETLYSGIFGCPLKAEIYMGVVYYQRLRHMVSDKSQARSTGPIDVLTHQPVKGRKKQGGIRFGEMERDALLAHGAAFCLHDRLMLSSDYSEGYICENCGGILACYRKVDVQFHGTVYDKDAEKIRTEQEMVCKTCGANSKCQKVALPYVFRLLANELAAMNVRLTLSTK